LSFVQLFDDMEGIGLSGIIGVPISNCLSNPVNRKLISLIRVELFRRSIQTHLLITRLNPGMYSSIQVSFGDRNNQSQVQAYHLAFCYPTLIQAIVLVGVPMSPLLL